MKDTALRAQIVAEARGVFRDHYGVDAAGGPEYAVVPHPGVIAVPAPERYRRASCKKSRAERHKLFARIRRMLATRKETP